MDPRLDVFAAAPTAAVSDLARRFDETAVVIETDETHVLIALSIANLAARLWPNTRVIGPAMTVADWPFVAGELNTVSSSLVAAASLSTARPVTNTITIALGVSSSSASMYATADGWSLRMGPRPIDFLSGNPGPATTAAAALVAAEIFRLVVSEMPGVRLTEPVEWNSRRLPTVDCCRARS